MLQRENADERIEEALNSTQGMSRAEMPPFFYTRLMAKMDKGNIAFSAGFFSRPVLSLATLTILLVLNISVIIHYVKANDQTVKQTSGLQSLASEMNGDYSTAYDKTTN